MEAETEECLHDRKIGCNSTDDYGYFWQEMGSSFEFWVLDEGLEDQG